MRKIKILSIFIALVFCFFSPVRAATNTNCDVGDCASDLPGFGKIVEYEGTKMTCSASATPINGDSSIVIRVSVREIAPDGSSRCIGSNTLNANQQTKVIFSSLSINPGSGYKYRAKYEVISGGSDTAAAARVVVAISTW